MKLKFILMVLGLMLVLLSYSSAQVPQMINYQGKLTKSSGTVLDTTVQMVFSIYADSNGATLKWTETQMAVKVEKGIFNVLLGSSNPIPDSVFDGSVRYLGVKVGGDPEITPRKPMVSVPYAFRAGPDGGGGSCGWVDDGTVIRLQSNSDSVGIGTASPGARFEIAKDNMGPALLLTHPDATDAAWDNSPISALKIKAPPTATTRNFVSGLWIETNAAAVDKGRGVLVNNWGQSDGIYIQQDGTNGTGLAILQTSSSSNSAGAVMGTLLNTQTALVLRQETALDPNAQSSCLLAAEANGSPTEMVRLNSTVAGQVGIISRMTGDNSSPFVVKNPLDVDVIRLSSNGGAYFDEKVGIGTSTPAQRLDVAGTAQMTGFKMPTGAANGYVLTSDTTGVGTWKAAAGETYWGLRISDTADTTLITHGAWGIARYGSTLYGNADSTHVNLGVACTTGTNGENYKYCTVGGGRENSAGGAYSTVGGGWFNAAGGGSATVGGGYFNLATGLYATVAGGRVNIASEYCATVGGGKSNVASGDSASVGGGARNTASGSCSTVPGGSQNTAAGDYSFAAGYRAKANHNGSFVWADPAGEDFASTAENQFLIRALGGVGIYNSNNTGVVRFLTTETGTDGSLLALYEADGTKTVHIDAEGVTYGGAQVSLEDHDGTTTISLDAESGASNGGAFVSMHDGVGTKTIHLDADGADGGAQVSLIDHDSTTTISLDAESGVNGGAIMKLLTGGGDATIQLDADYQGTGEGRVITTVLEITGGSDLSEQFEIQTNRADVVASPGMVVCIDPEHPGELLVSGKAYDPTVAGIISGAGGIKPGLLMGQANSVSDGQYAVALTGRVYCWVDASYSPIKPGDLLTTSDTPGHAMKVTNYAKAQGAIIGKAMSSLEQGQGLVLVLVTLQ